MSGVAVLLAQQAVADGRALSPARTIASARRYLKDPQASFTRIQFEDSEKRSAAEWTFYTARTADGQRISVRASDGRVMSWSKQSQAGPPGIRALPPTIASAAHAAAEAMAKARCPQFDPATWRMEWDDDGSDTHGYVFVWTLVLSEWGVTDPHSLVAYVDGISGECNSLFIPPDRITGPTVPRVARRVALKLAAQVAPFDPARVPFDEEQLQLIEDLFGQQRLFWRFHQSPPPAAGDRPDGPLAPGPVWISVNAITGEIDVGGGFSEGGVAPRTRQGLQRLAPHQARARRQGCRVQVLGGGPTLGDAQTTALREGRVWLRVEALRMLGARETATPNKLRVRLGERCLDSERLGAQYRGNAWWISARNASKGFGWGLTWDPRKRLAGVALPKAAAADLTLRHREVASTTGFGHPGRDNQ